MSGDTRGLRAGEGSFAAGGPAGPARGRTLGGAFGLAVGTLGAAGRLLASPMHLPGLRKRAAGGRKLRPGAMPGIDHLAEAKQAPELGQLRIQSIDYSPDSIHIREVTDLDALLNEPPPQAPQVRWINVDGLHPWVVSRFREKFSYHTLAAEDVLHVPQRPKFEEYDGQLFLVGRMLRLVDGVLMSEQVSFFLTPGMLVTFQERPGDMWEPIRERLKVKESRLRRHGAGFLLYALLDALVDHGFPILEHYGDVLERLEEETLDRPTPQLLHRIHSVKRELILIRRNMWPMREVVDQLRRSETKLLSANTKVFLRDVQDHVTQLIEIIETFREMGGGLTDLYMSTISNRMNEVMKVLTIMASVFIPITFLAGVYGMNFDHLPELHWRHGYWVFWAVCLGVVAGLVCWFRRKGWLGRGGW